MSYLPVIFMGVNSIILQIICLRKLLSTFSGNELIIGLSLATWLIIVSLGSFIGSRIKFKNAFGLSFILVSVISQPTILLIESIRPILAFELGEIIPLPSIFLWTTISMAALCITIGIQFPLAVSHLRDKAPQTYGFEAIGAFAGGAIFTFFLSGNVSSYSLVTIIAIINIFVSVYLLKRKAVFLSLIFPILFYACWPGVLSLSLYRGAELVKSAESRYGEITVLKIKNQFNVYSSGKYQFSYPDLQTEEMTAHLPMSLYPAAKKLLVVGGSPAVIREFLKYPVSRIDFVEIDPVLINVSKELLNPEDSGHLNDTRVKILHIDGRKHIKSVQSGEYDLIVLSLPEPATANINRFYTVEFFKEAKAVLKEKGILYLSLPVSYGYIGRRMQVANGSIYASLKKVFSYVDVSSEEYGIFFASMIPVETNPDVLAGHFVERGIHTRYFRPYILTDAFSPLQVSMVRARLGKIKNLNTDLRPVSYLYNLMLWAEMYGGKWLNILLGLSEYKMLAFTGIILIFLTLFFIRQKETISYALFTTGYFTMAFSIVLILAFQARSGYIYEKIGLLTGTFMLGSAVGSGLMRNSRNPLSWLKLLDIMGIILLAAAIPFMKKDLNFYFFILSAGLLGGGQFAAASLSLKEKGYSGAAGRLYAIDLAGSFLGSFLTAIVMVPLTGIQNTILFLICIKMLSFIFLVRVGSAGNCMKKIPPL